MKLATVFCCSKVASDCCGYCEHHHHHNNNIFGDGSILLHYAVDNNSFEELPTSTFRLVREIFGSRKLVTTYSCLA